MKNIIAKTEELVETIKTSNEYVQYQMLQNTISKDEALYRRLNEFRRRNFENQMNDMHYSMEKNSNLCQEYADVLNKAEVKDFLAAEQRYIKIIRQMNRKLDASLNINIDFLEN